MTHFSDTGATTLPSCTAADHYEARSPPDRYDSIDGPIDVLVENRMLYAVIDADQYLVPSYKCVLMMMMSFFVIGPHTGV